MTATRKWFKVKLARTRIVEIMENKLVAVEADSEEDLWGRLSEVYALTDAVVCWDQDGDGISVEPHEPDEAETDHEVCGVVESEDDRDVCDAEIVLPSKSAPEPTTPRGRMAAKTPKKSNRPKSRHDTHKRRART